MVLKQLQHIKNNFTTHHFYLILSAAVLDYPNLPCGKGYNKSNNKVIYDW